MKEFKYTIDGKEYKVEIGEINEETYTAEVKVNGESFEVGMEKPAEPEKKKVVLGKIIDHREMTSRFPAEFSHLLIRFKPVIIRIVKCIRMSVMSHELIREMRNISNA